MENEKKQRGVGPADTLDGLTKVNTRAAYEEALKNVKLADLCIIYFDINNLKHTNDTLGHRFGDKLITTVSDEIKNQFRIEEIFRIGGDEFVVLMNGVGPKVIEKRLSLIRDNLNAKTKEDKDGIVYQVAYGYSVSDGTKQKIELENEAERKMYLDKKALKAKAPSNDTGRPLPPVRGFGGGGIVVEDKPAKSAELISDETMNKVNENVKDINRLYLDVSKSSVAGIVIAVLTFLTLTGILLYM